MPHSRVLSNFGIHVYGFAAVAIGIIGLVWRDFSTVWQPVPADLPHRTALACIAAVCLLCTQRHSRHYLPFLTMSSDIGQRSAEANKIESQRGRTERTTRHSLVDPTGC